ncbi:hypothetical protein E3N88_13198 [Mikania micrantha]|uniref:Uncharacterized protein n=1 Tax=Mikania micrantha TaxID=192012 RepID=A0A5N6P900_9ASTR|nr:hypothetical protein E3N88_13198 [Mikania micrantha]
MSSSKIVVKMMTVGEDLTFLNPLCRDLRHIETDCCSPSLNRKLTGDEDERYAYVDEWEDACGGGGEGPSREGIE